jgi:hypothetical protein
MARLPITVKIVFIQSWKINGNNYLEQTTKAENIGMIGIDFEPIV